MRRLARRGRSVSAACLAFAFLLAWAPLRGQSTRSLSPRPAPGQSDWETQPKYKPGEVLIRFRTGSSPEAMASAHAAVSGQVAKTWGTIPGLQLVRLSNLSVGRALQRYRQNPDVLYAEPNYLVHAFATPNDPDFSQLWNLQNTGQLGGVPGADLHATQAWNLTTGSASVVVAILDTGIDYTHPDLVANVWSSPSAFSQIVNGVRINCSAGAHGFNAITGTCDPNDDNGHGTHVSGIIGAVGNNGTGVVGVNWTVQLVACKFLDQHGSGADSDAITCLDFVKALKDNGVNIVASNNSWGGTSFSHALSDAVAAQQQDGILFIAASGNDFRDNDQLATYPSSYDLANVISVTATTRFDAVADFANVGQHSVYIGAPGQEILSTTPNNTYSVFNGTSMAAPQVTGVAALLAAQDSTRDWRTIKNLILSGGDKIGALQPTITGRRLDAYGSMNCSGAVTESRLQPVPNVIAGSPGSAIRLEELSINCGQPNGPVQVAVSPGGSVVNLVDDGTGNDLASGDGVYSGQWTPAAEGNYTLTFPGGDRVDVEVLGNYAASQTPFSYLTITGTNLNLNDDSVAQIQSPFPVPFGGGYFNTLHVNSNGTISFTEGFNGYLNLPLPQHLPTVNGGLQLGPSFFSMVAPFWQDLYPIPNSNQNVFWEVAGAAPNRRMVVEWRNVRSFECRSNSTANVTFEVVFSEASSDIVFNYANASFGGACASLDHGAAATVGIQTSPGTGSQWSYNSQDVGDNMAILWQLASGTSSPPNPLPATASISPTSAQMRSAGRTITVNGSNFTPLSHVQWNAADRITTYVSGSQLTALITSADLTGTVFGGPGTASITVSNPAPGGGVSNAQSFTLLAPGPNITSLSPSSMQAGTFSFQLTVNGNGFVPLSSIYWNGQPSPFTVYQGPNQLVGAVFSPQVANAGTAQVTVVSPSPGGGTSNAVGFTIQPVASHTSYIAQPQRAVPPGTLPPPLARVPPPPYQFLGWRYALKRGGDYLTHFMRPRAGSALPIVTPQDSGRSGSSALSHTQNATPLGVAGFVLPKSLPANFLPASVATGDFNRDGNKDWVIANAGSNDLWIYLGNGDGTSSLPTISALRGDTPVLVIAADLRGTGISDLVVAEPDSNSVEVLLGNGDGTFRSGALYYVPSPPVNLAARDFNGDGKIDILVGMLGATTSGSLGLLPGDATGHFGPLKLGPLDGVFARAPVSMAIADLNGDGFPDVLVADPANDVLLSYINHGDGTFKLGQTIFVGGAAVGEYVISAAAGDLNGDGCADAIVTDTFADIYVFLGNCDGTFQNNLQTQVGGYGVGDVAMGAVLVDVNHDGKLDLVTSGFVLTEDIAFGQTGGNIVSVLLGDGKGNFTAPRLYRGEPSMVGLAVADLNKDGFPDLVTADQDSDSATVFLNDGSGAFGKAAGRYMGYLNGVGISGVINAPASNFISVDLNGDGHTDLAALELGQHYPEPYQLLVALNDGTGSFGATARYPVADAVSQVGDFKFADFRNTGHPDFVAIGNQFSTGFPYIAFAPNNGNGTFGKTSVANLPGAQGLLGVGDFDRDGKQDLVVVAGDGFCSNGSNACLTVFLGNGDGTFRKGYSTSFASNTGIGGFPGSVYVGDFNKDGKQDVLVRMSSTLAGTLDKDVFEFLGNGDGTFQPAKDILPHFGGFAIADLNHDGLLDIVEMVLSESTLTTGPPAFAIYLGQPDGTFTLTNTYSPYGGDFGLGYAFGQGVFLTQNAPMVADFNGDGNPDIAVFQQVPGDKATTLSRQSYLQILLGNGDGTFTPSYNAIAFHQLRVPNHAIDLNGDGKADLVELDHYSSSFSVLPATTGPAFQIAMESQPVVGTNGGVVISLSIPSTSATTISLSATDPAVSIPTSVTIPAGTVAQIIPFQIGPSFKPTHVFAIQGQLGQETEAAYGFQSTATAAYGFTSLLGNATETTVAGGQTLDYGIQILSLGGYATTLQLACTGLPAGFTCQFGQNPMPVPAGYYTVTSLIVSAPANALVGSYPFKIVASDSTYARQLAANLAVGDFKIQTDPQSQTVLPNGTVTYGLQVIPVNGFSQMVNLSCGNLPAGVTCAFGTPSLVPGFNGGFTLTVPALAQETYSFSVLASSGPATRTASARFVVGGLVGSVSPTSAPVNVGSSANFNVSVSGQNGFNGTVSFNCPSIANASVLCVFNPPQVTLVPGSPGSAQLVISVSGISHSRMAGRTAATTNRTDRREKPFRLAALSLVAGFVLLPCAARNSRLKRLMAFTFLAVAMMLIPLAGCGGGSGAAGGGGGGGSGGSGGGGGGGGSLVVVQVPVQAIADQVSVSLGTISLTVPQ